MGSSEKSYYIFQGNSLLVPSLTADSQIDQAIEPGKELELTKNLAEEEADFYSVPSLNESGPVNAMMLHIAAIPAGWKQIPVRQAVSMMNAGNMAEGIGNTGRILRSFHIGQWRRESRFCGSCGSRNRDSDSEVARLCPSCGRLEYPRISPAVITLITNDKNETLLAHNKKFTSKIYSLVAGFNEAGESLETTVAREIREEVSIEVCDIRYICSQPWPFPNSLMIGFAARYAGGSIRADGFEIEDAYWFARDRLPLLPATGSVSRYLIDLWLENKL